ncbi:2881_t:CDS:2, partial [Acaulospora colombiana]
GETDEEAIDQLQKERDMLDHSMAGMAAFSPSKPDFAGAGSRIIARPSDPPPEAPGMLRISNGGGMLSESLRSDFSINDFPSPPGSLSNRSTGETTPPDTTTAATTVDTLLSQMKPSPSTNQSVSPIPTEVVEDVQFAMVRPRIPASYQRRRASFPSVVRESATSSNDGMFRIISAYAESEDDLGGKRVRMSSANNRLDVTSFIGGFPPRDLFQGRNDSVDYRLSPLPEDTTPRGSAEIIDMRLKTPSIVPAIAISTSETASVETGRTRKVSFAPASYEPVSRPKLRIPPAAPANTLPSSPRPGGGSPSASPKPFGNFKPATPSPLTKTSFGPSGVPNATVPLRRAGSARAYVGGGNSRPVITGPFPLRSAENTENDYTVPRRAPLVRTQRFL